MKDLYARTAFAPALVLLASTACGGGGVPSASSALQPSSVRIGYDAAARNLSGQYAGKVKDNVYGFGRAAASLAQYKSTLGGSENDSLRVRKRYGFARLKRQWNGSQWSHRCIFKERSLLLFDNGHIQHKDSRIDRLLLCR